MANKDVFQGPLEEPGGYGRDLQGSKSLQTQTLVKSWSELQPPSIRRLLEPTHPEIDAHGGDEAAGQKGRVLETDQQAGLPHARVPDQHHLAGDRKRAARTSASGCSDAAGGKRSQSLGAPAILEALGQGVRGAGLLRPEQGQGHPRPPAQSWVLLHILVHSGF